MDPVTIWLLVLATLWLLRMLVEELVAAIRGRDSPRLARREARERLAEQHGTPTVGQAITNRLARRIDNPPQRRWAAEVRQFLAELTADAVAEARVRHHVNMRARAQRRGRAAGWTAQTGGATPTPPPPAPEPEPDDVDEAFPCEDCWNVLVVPPEVICDDCARSAAQPDPKPPPTDIRPDNTEPDRKEPPMGTITHTIAADVRNPCFALQFSTDCRNFAYAVSGQMELIIGVMRRARLGEARIAAANVLHDEVRGYIDETGQSIEAYAKHLRIQDRIQSDPDLVHTIDETYLGGGTSDHRGVTPPKDTGVPPELDAGGARTPEDCERFWLNFALCFNKLRDNADTVVVKQGHDGVTGRPVELLEAQRDRTSRIAIKADAEADAYRQHAATRNDTIGSDPSLHGTQDGKYLSQTGA